MLLIFDCDGVLVDSEMIANRVLAAQLSAIGFPITASQCMKRFVGKWMTDVVNIVREEGCDVPDDFIAALKVRDKEAFERELEPMPGVLDVIRDLRHARCVASSGSVEKMETTLGLGGLLPYFQPHLFSASMVKRGKPEPDLFLYAAQQMGQAAEFCLVIEDSTSGVLAAKRAGMRVWGFGGGSHAKQNPDHETSLRQAGAETVFHDMTRLPDMLAEL